MVRLLPQGFGNISNNQILSSLDIGSGKISCFISKISGTGEIEIIGAGHQESKGLSAGIITDLGHLEYSIRKCVDSAEKMASETVKSVILGFSSGKPQSKILKVEVELQGSIISDKDLDKIYKSLSEKTEFEGREILHAIPLQFSIDESKGIKNPVGMYGDKLGLDISIISVEENAIKNFTRVVNKADLEIRRVIYSPYACGFSVLNDEERELGVALVDIGFELTRISIFINNAIVFTKTVPLGGVQITKDIAKIFSLSILDSEKIKIINGQLIESSSENLSSIEANPLGKEYELSDPVEVSRGHLIKIIKPRVQEILEIIKLEISNSGYEKIISNRVVFTGGAAQMDGLVYLATEILDKKSILGKPKVLKGIPDNMSGAAFSTVNGLLQFLVEESKDLKSKILFNNKEDKKIGLKISNIKQWFVENF